MRRKNRTCLLLGTSCFGRCRWLIRLTLLRYRRTEALSALVNALLSSLFHTTFCVTIEPVLKLQA